MKSMKHIDWDGILVYVESVKGQIQTVGMELIGEAIRLSHMKDKPIYAVGIGSGMEAVGKQLERSGVNQVFLYETTDEYDPIHYEKIMIRCIQEIRPSIVLIGGTYEGRALAPRLAVAFKTGLTADCTELSVDEEGNLIQTRPAFGGNVMASIMTKSSRPQLATVRTGMMQPFKTKNQSIAQVTLKDVKDDFTCIDICKIEQMEEVEEITSQKTLVVAGRGVQKKDDLDMLRELAALLGGKLASSRALVEKGWMSQAEQIGLSGNSVSPEYILTFGVSGTVQFMAGMKHSKNIIAVNKDPRARIFDYAHYPVCGDLYEIVPEMIKELKKRG